MSALQNKIDFVALISVTLANPNGDPLNGNRPRTNYEGIGEISDVCIKRKIRNRLQDMGERIFVQSADRADDEFASLSERAGSVLKDIKDEREYANLACATWLDVRAFGQVFAFKSQSKASGVSVGVRGPVSIHQAVSQSPVEVISMQITKSVNSEPGDGRGSDTMGMKHFIRFGLYKIKGSINVQLAEKTGFSEDDAKQIKKALETLFDNDTSSARPDGSMQVERLYWFRHNCPSGQYPAARVHRSIRCALKEQDALPQSVEDYVITVEPLEGLVPEVFSNA
jgi:CRISPR-associated protein Csd2